MRVPALGNAVGGALSLSPGRAVLSGVALPPATDLAAYYTYDDVDSGGSADPYAANVVLLARMESTAFVDETGRHTVVGTTSSPAVAPALFGNGSSNTGVVYSNSADFDFGTGDFTFEFTYNPTSFPADVRVIAAASNSTTGYVFYVTNAGELNFYIAGMPAGGTTGLFLATGVQNRISITKLSGILHFHRNGVHVSSQANVFPVNALGLALGIGTQGDGNGGAPVGTVDEVRITKGVARYGASSYTPSGVAFDTIGTGILVNRSSQAGRFDLALANVPSTAAGSVTGQARAHDAAFAQIVTYPLVAGNPPPPWALSSLLNATSPVSFAIHMKTAAERFIFWTDNGSTNAIAFVSVGPVSGNIRATFGITRNDTSFARTWEIVQDDDPATNYFDLLFSFSGVNSALGFPDDPSLYYNGKAMTLIGPATPGNTSIGTLGLRSIGAATYSGIGLFSGGTLTPQSMTRDEEAWWYAALTADQAAKIHALRLAGTSLKTYYGL